MTRTKTGRVARELSKDGFIFNDRLRDGRRSLKVWGWSERQYLLAKEKLEALDCTVKVVRVALRGKPPGGFRLRLHVTE